MGTRDHRVAIAVRQFPNHRTVFARGHAGTPGDAVVDRGGTGGERAFAAIAESATKTTR